MGESYDAEESASDEDRFAQSSFSPESYRFNASGEEATRVHYARHSDYLYDFRDADDSPQRRRKASSLLGSETSDDGATGGEEEKAEGGGGEDARAATPPRAKRQPTPRKKWGSPSFSKRSREMDKENVTKFRNMNGVVVDVLTTTTT